MDLERVINPLMVTFDEDIRANNGPSHITDLVVLTIKSLLPSEETVSVDIDYIRYKEEINLWRYYRHGENPSLMNILDGLEPNIYWRDKDDTLYYRLLPIILANKDFSSIRQEVIKNILFTTGNVEVLIEGLLLSKLIHYLILGKEDIIYELKEEVINFSQIEFLERYKKLFRISLEEYKGKYAIEFEQNKIYALNTLNISFSHRFKTLEDCLKVLLEKAKPSTTIGKCINFYKEANPNINFSVDKYYYELAQYVYNLRNGRIDPKLLKIDEYNLPDIFKFQEGQVFYHSLLNKSKVIKREDIDNKTIIHLKTKSGIYRFINN